MLGDIEMKKALAHFALALMACITAVAADAGDLKVVVENVKGSDGKVRVALFNNAGEFPRGAFFKGREQDSRPGAVQVIFNDVPAGDYAIVAFQDKNSNGRLDRDLIGFPTEPLGFSKDASITIGPPAFSDAKFSFDGGSQTQTVKLH